jgi:hypothetical protein
MFSGLPTIHSETSPSTASSHAECCRGEMYTLHRLKVPPTPYKCLATTNVIESPQAGVARHTANVTWWRDREIVERWVASASWANRRRSWRKINRLLLPAFSYGWDTSGWARDPNFRW